MTTQASNRNTTPYAESAAKSSIYEQSHFLRPVFIGNAIFSALCALILLIDTEPIALFLGWPLLWPLRVVGVGLLPFALLVILTARQRPLNRRLAWLVIEMDLAWVVASVALLLLQWPAMTTVGGRWAIGAVAEIVAIFAILQVIGLRRIGK